jgi:hypothetical protein
VLASEFQELKEKISSIQTRIEPLEAAYVAISKVNGYETAKKWGHQSEYWALNDELADLCVRETDLVDTMIKLRPKTLVGIAALATAFKADQDHFWKKPEPDRDWDISLLTRFLDGLIDLDRAACVSARMLADTESDPTLALVAKVRAAWNRVGEIIIEDGGDEGERCAKAWRVFRAAQAELLKTRRTQRSNLRLRGSAA